MAGITCPKCGKVEYDKLSDRGLCGYPATDYCNLCFENRWNIPDQKKDNPCSTLGGLTGKIPCPKCGQYETGLPYDKGACGGSLIYYCNKCFKEAECTYEKPAPMPEIKPKYYEDTNPKYGDFSLKAPIIGVAIKYKDLVICLPKPNRHGDVIRYMINTLGFPAPITHENPQGFYTAAGEFLDRKQALARVKEIKQLMIDRKEELFSEDLW